MRKKDQDDIKAFCWLWDFAGQKDFYATHQVFMSKCAVYLLVTDSLKFSTAEKPGVNFEDSAQYVRFWFDVIHCYWSTRVKGRLDPPIIVVCTNEDKFKEPLERQKRQKEFKDNLRQVLKEQKKKLHLRNIYFVSNTEDADVVFEEIRIEISRHAMNMQDWGKDCPFKWLLFQQVLLKMKDSDVPISSTETLLKIAKFEDIGFSKDDDVKQCLQYCHDIGTVVYFDGDKIGDPVILDPKWLVNAFRCLVSDKIENVIKVSDDWQKLTETGELTYSLICRLFMKEPKLKCLENKTHLIEVTTYAMDVAG
ncbi:probable serine/threonine-protein kinase roco6 [Mytilus californianus]|uniref:probable serine/threonine-protein kinase roco6 n=1 Tax=Mytilus californianus TaxID=6549 RepID=UPI002245846B|nr:probable serine/threonine-protein kinase roco6 [Mytilus californianus]